MRVCTIDMLSSSEVHVEYHQLKCS